MKKILGLREKGLVGSVLLFGFGLVTCSILFSIACITISAFIPGVSVMLYVKWLGVEVCLLGFLFILKFVLEHENQKK